MMAILLMLLTAASVPLPAESDCLPIGGAPPLVALNEDADVLQTFDAKGRLAVSTDGGARWQIKDCGCREMPLQFWRRVGTPQTSCMAYRRDIRSRESVDAHVCTSDGGESWKTVFEISAEEGYVSDVTANGRSWRVLVGVKSFEQGNRRFARLIRTADGGDTWVPMLEPFGSLKIVADLRDGTFLVLTGDTAASYNGLSIAGFEDAAVKKVMGPWSALRGAQLTQAAVNPFDAAQWLVSVWRPGDKKEVTYVSRNAGLTFVVLAVPDEVVWPLEFVDATGTLLANVRPEDPWMLFFSASVFSPRDGRWTTVKLPDRFGGIARARGGAVFSKGYANLHRLTEITEAEPRWADISLPEPPIGAP